MPGTSSFGTIDDLVYTYNPSGNRLIKVEDSAPINTEGFKNGSTATTEYTYDDNGNMKTDANKGITGISYNYLNLPTDVTLTGGTINYVYDATGVKQRKIAGTITTDYANGYQYENNLLKFFPQPEGYVACNNGVFDYIYQYKDHLGNVRLSYGDADNNGSVTNAEIVEESNYYPFGLRQLGYNGATVLGKGNSTGQKYKYSGKELQDELGFNMYDFGARNYDPALGRWMNIDPLAEHSPEKTLYHYCSNNPINRIDPTGMCDDPNCTHGALRRGWDAIGRFFGNAWGHSENATAAQNNVTAGPIEQIPEQKEEPGFFKQFLLATPVLGATINSSDKMGEGNYAGAAADFGVGVLDLFTLGTANKYKAGSEVVIGSAEKAMATNAAEGAGAELNVLSKSEILRIENAATRINKPITVVGSRAKGTAGAFSDWDYVIPGLNSRNWSTIKNSLPGSRSVLDNTPRNIDIFKGPVNSNLPHITISPR